MLAAGDRDIEVAVPTARLRVRKEMEHDSTCGNKKWFDPLPNVHHADLGIADRTRSVARRSGRVELYEQALSVLRDVLVLTLAPLPPVGVSGNGFYGHNHPMSEAPRRELGLLVHSPVRGGSNR